MMFKTYSTASVFNPLADETEKYWSYAELSVNHIWFLVKISILDDDYSFNSTLLLSSTEQLKELEKRESIKVVEVHVVSPSHKNNGKTWKMNQVSKIFKGTQKYKDYEAPIFKYEFIDGNVLVDSKLSRKLTKSTIFETLYSL